jgi:hypothetical protein
MISVIAAELNSITTNLNIVSKLSSPLPPTLSLSWGEGRFKFSYQVKDSRYSTQNLALKPANVGGGDLAEALLLLD